MTSTIRTRGLGEWIAALILLCALPLPAAAQQPGEEEEVEPIGYIGLFGGIGFNTHMVALDPLWLTGSQPAPADNLFVEGSGTGLTAGLLLELPLSGSFGFGVRAALQNRGGEMEATYLNTSDITTTGGTPRQADVNATVVSRLPYLAFTPHFRVMPQSLPLYFFAGPSILMPLGPTYDYTEAIALGGQGLVFAGTNVGTRSRALDRELRGAGTKLAVTLGLGVEVFITPTIALIADAQYSPMIGSVSSDIESSDTWRADMTSITAGLKFGFGRRGAPPPPPPPPPIAVDTTAADTVEQVRVGVLSGDELRDTLVARNQRVKQTEVYALLPYVFFPKDSAIIPSRYRMLDRRDVRDWREATIEAESALDIYYDLLNIIGYRMRRNRRATLKITGCLGLRELGNTYGRTASSATDPDSVDLAAVDSLSTDTVASDGHLALARARATAVRDYLRDVWRIREENMEIVVRELPVNASLSEVDPVRGDIENQRVEFHASDLGVLSPVRIPDSLLLQPTGVIRLFPPAPDRPDSIAAAESWEVDVRVGDSLIKRAATGYGAPPETIDIALESRPDLNRRGPIEITSELVLIDSTFEERRRVGSNTVWFVEEGGFLVDRNVEDGMYVDRYNLLLYSFDSADIFDFSFQAEEILREKIHPESEVTVIGHTDVIGLPSYNKKLSQRRAETAARILGLTEATVVGAGERDLLYDNDHPEGRYYCRTVTVVVRTPVSAEDLQEQERIEELEEETSATSLPLPPAEEESAENDDAAADPVDEESTEEVPTSVSVPE